MNHLKKGKFLSYLLSSNLVALFLSFFKIHVARDTPDNKAVPPVAAPAATAVTGEAVETL